jgi:hypothetical protein
LAVLVRNAETWAGFSVAAVTPELLDAWRRMLRLMNRAGDIPVLAPAYEREILNRALQGPHAALLRDVATPSTALARINLAIQWIRQHVTEPAGRGACRDRRDEPLRLPPPLQERHGTGPVQFQKRIHVLQARLLLVSGGLRVGDMAFDVGYESATRFSREYAGLFGAPPAKDAARIFRNLQQPRRAVEADLRWQAPDGRFQVGCMRRLPVCRRQSGLALS